MDKSPELGLLSPPMAQSDQKLTSPASLLLDAVLVIGFFFFMYGVLRPHVPSSDPKMIMLWAGLTSGCMTGVFWLALQMFRVVLRMQLAQKKK